MILNLFHAMRRRCLFTDPGVKYGIGVTRKVSMPAIPPCFRVTARDGRYRQGRDSGQPRLRGRHHAEWPLLS
ncbi:hypothetical protein D3P04_21660 [Paracoccus onubensis]|uniref:Uncharacterized protein n=1 Tax=Paracoccus onubensis TaxID=1675788 RepID=A0A418SM74_9RHOB|nr:hypothetical protein D3P04_21660 [Paracoccus onubensis]